MEAAKENKNVKKEVKKVAKKKAKKTVEKVLGQSTGALKTHLRMQSHYLRSLLDPLNEFGAKVPDAVTQPSLTTHCIQRLQVLSGAAGVCGISVNIGSLASTGSNASDCDIATVNALVPAPAGRPPFPISQKTGALPGASGDFSWVQWDGLTGAKTYASGLRNVASQARLVSAGIYGFFQGTPTTMSGRFISHAWSRIENLNGSSYQQPPSPVIAGTIQPPPQTVAVALASRMATDQSLIATKGRGQIKWLPADAGDHLYANVNTLDGNYTSTEVGRLTLIFDGIPSGTLVEFWVVENYEVLPQSSTLSFVQPTPSPSDPLEMALVDNVISENPNLQLAPMKTTPAQLAGKVSAMHNGPMAIDVSSRPSDSPSKGILDTILDTIERVAPVGISLAKAAGPLLALI